MALLTVTQLREHVETDLPDAALTRILNAEDAEIVRRFGPAASASETLAGNSLLLFLGRSLTAVTTVTETDADGTTTTLAADDYRTWPGSILERLATGTNGRLAWAPLVTVTYAPTDDQAQRIHALVQLCQLAARYTGMTHESVGQGDYAVTLPDYRRERERLLNQLAPRGGLWLA